MREIVRIVDSSICRVSDCPCFGVLCTNGVGMNCCPKENRTLDRDIARRACELGIADMVAETVVERTLANPDEYPRYENPDGTHFPMNPRYEEIPVLRLRKKTNAEMLRDIREKMEEQTNGNS